MAITLNDVNKSLVHGLTTFGNYTKNAARTANGVSWGAQQAAGQYNQRSADIANQLATERLAEQYRFNSAQSALANQFNTDAWDKAAQWNQQMWLQAAQYNSAEAQKNRDFQERMSNTAYRRAILDMQQAGLNPILAVQGLGPASTPSGGAGSISAANMSPATANMASGGVLGGDSASISGFTGQMENVSGTLGLLSAAIGGLSSAAAAMGGLGAIGKAIGEFAAKVFTDPKEDTNSGYKSILENTNRGYKDIGDWFKDFSREHKPTHKNNGIDWKKVFPY